MVFWKKKSSGRSDVPARAPQKVPVEPPKSAILDSALFEKRPSVQVLLEAIAKVSESRDLETLLVYVVDRAIEVTGAERGLLLLLGDDGKQTVRVARLDGAQDFEGEIKYSTSVVQGVVESKTPMRTTVQSDAEALELGASVFDLKLRAVMCVSLTPQGPDANQHGALYVDSRAATREFKDDDLTLFSALAKHIDIALENARLNIASLEKAKLERSLEIASEIQSDLMPKQPQSIPGIEIFGWYRPAEHASGDFYDFVKTRDGKLIVVVGDVTGHGIGPALITATAQASLRSYARVVPDPAGIVTMLNQDLGERMDSGMFLTLFLALIDGEGRVQILNAGGTPPLIWRKASGKIERIDGTGPALGMVPDFEFEEGPAVELEPGDVLMAFTDGLVEARHVNRPDRLFDESGIRAVLADTAASGGSVKALAEAVVESVLEFSGGTREDDMTIVAVQRAGESG